MEKLKKYNLFSTNTLKKGEKSDRIESEARKFILRLKEMKIEGKKVGLLKKLKEEGKINSDFETKLSSISLEDLIALKLELSSRNFGGKMFGLPILQSVKEIVNDALLKFSFSASKTKKEASALLGLSTKDYRQYLRKFKIEDQFKKNEK